ncbi:MAG: hypothetical protein IPM25_08980 [Chloracidobacterium sp.]|nr:hypothetical protein [Chloracidobacterium sp.]
MLTFRTNNKKYLGSTALEIVRALEADAENYRHRGQSLRQFLVWSLQSLSDRLPPRDLDLSDRLDDDELALSYLYLRDEYGAGKFEATP